MKTFSVAIIFSLFFAIFSTNKAMAHSLRKGQFYTLELNPK